MAIDEKKLIEELEKQIVTITTPDDPEIRTKYWNTGISYALNCIEKQPKVGKWIPVSERLPEDETLMYWTTHEDGSLVMHGYKKRNGFIYNWEVDDLEKRKRQGQVIAWTPIFEPEPYKEPEK